MRKRGEKPPLPRSREGNENPISHCHNVITTGRRVSRQPEAGKPIHQGYPRGRGRAQVLFPTIFHTFLYLRPCDHQRHD